MPGWLNEVLIYGRWVIFALVYLAGLIAAIMLLRQAKGNAAILAAVSFGLLLLQDVGQIVRRIFLDNVLRNVTKIEGIWEVNNCCCGIFQLAAFVCLIIAVWQAVAGPPAAAEEEEEVE